MILLRLKMAMTVVPATRMALPTHLKSCTRWKITQEKRLEAKSSAPPWKPSGMAVPYQVSVYYEERKAGRIS